MRADKTLGFEAQGQIHSLASTRQLNTIDVVGLRRLPNNLGHER